MTSLNEADVLARFSLLAGLSGEETEPYRPLCADAMREIERGERSGCGSDSSGPLAAAAAALACCRAALAQSGRETDAFSAGDVRVTPVRANLESARGLWCSALAAASPYLTDPNFFFRGTSA